MRRLALLGALAVALLAVVPAHAQVPRYIVAHGGSLGREVLLDDGVLNEALVKSDENRELGFVARRGDRPFVELALFVQEPNLQGRSPGALKPSEATGSGRFYPQIEDLPPAVEVLASKDLGRARIGVPAPNVLDYLARKGIEVKSSLLLPPEPTPTTAPLPRERVVVEDDDGPPRAAWIALGVTGVLGVGALAYWWNGQAGSRRKRGGWRGMR